MNDNCPIMNETFLSFEPVPALEVDPILYTAASDADSGLNSEIYYYVSDITAEYVVQSHLAKKNHYHIQ